MSATRPRLRTVARSAQCQVSVPKGVLVHTLITGADKPSSDAKLTIEGTDFLLVVMPEIERTPGKIAGYLIPTKIAVEAVRTSQQAWLDSKPNTHGENKTPCLWFRKNGKTRMSSDYETKWAKYRRTGEAYTNAADVVAVGDIASANTVASDGSVKAEVEIARQRISKAAGVSPDAVRITIGF